MATVLKAFTYLLFGDFSITNIPYIWVNIKFNFYELDSRDVYSLHGKTQWQVFLLFSGRYICVPHAEGRQHGVSIQLQSSIKLDNTVHQNICHTKNRSDMIESWQDCLHIHLLSSPLNWIVLTLFFDGVCERFIFLLPFSQMNKVAKEQIKKVEKTQLPMSMEKTPLLQDTSEDTASTSYYLGNEVRN